MRESGYYPPGAEFDPSAPYNQEEVPDEDFEITCSQSLSKTVTVTTNNYIPGASGVDYERDDEGGTIAIPYHEDPDTSDTNWADEYREEHLTPLELIKKLRSLLLDIDSDALKSNPCYQHKQYYIDECSNWTEDETEFVEN